MSSNTAIAPSEPMSLTDPAEVAQTIEKYGVVIVDFYADWCGPCQMMEPTIESVANKTDAAVLKVDVDRFQNLAAEYGVQGVPTLLIFVDGELDEQLVGVQSEEQLVKVLQSSE